MKKQWVYHIKSALTGQKHIGGTMTAATMEEAAKKAIQLNQITYLKEEERSEVTGLLLPVNHKHIYKGKEVYVSITAHPEYL